MTVLLYATIWTALLLFAAAEAGRTRLAAGNVPAHWAWAAWNLGGALTLVHLLVALDLRYGWNHGAAAAETARRSAEVYGVGWRGSIYVNYLFVVCWFAESWRWRRAAGGRAPSATGTWLLRLFFLIVIVNGAIVFAVHDAGRVAGVLIVAVLLWSWTAPGGVAGFRSNAGHAYITSGTGKVS